ncbi:dihydrofolate reductase [Actinomycetaceae bacterium TAE3-ERU4]|nr:dihydrofolate reductase [Actinomycetaceae bacterium TAE3-ERU4]
MIPKSLRLGAIWAQDKNGTIALEGQIPWYIPADFKHFRESTTGCPIIMGRASWDSLPRKPLPGRANIVLSRTLTIPEEGMILANSYEQAYREASLWLQEQGVEPKNPYGVNTWITGGGKVYKDSLDDVSTVVVSLVETVLEIPDRKKVTTAPVLNPEEWEIDTRLSDVHTRTAGNELGWKIFTYRRKPPK